ncbi:hypothetical protein [Dyadobacter bucti]|uniref:hypothetical protein n=1 Tax=Dyadobacter bucti TaxID=2572203 RepID=UPI001107C8A2|nr:hypothetical protein [Dyadobacter bucti]
MTTRTFPQSIVIGLKIDEMEQATKLNSMQLFMVKIFDKQLISTQETEIKQLLSDYFAKQIDTEMDEIWSEKGLLQKDLDDALLSHRRTEYRDQ